MSVFVVSKSPALSGNVKISGAKNGALPILAASILTDEECVISSVPPLKDVFVMIDILKKLGADIDYDEKKEKVTVCCKNIGTWEEDSDDASKLRASFIIMGPLLARMKKARIPLPGGCQIGSRPVDLHLKGFQAMGATIEQKMGFISAKTKKLIGDTIYLDFPSVGATENIMMAAALASGVTVIENAAAEPEICDLAKFLCKMGAKVTGAGTDTIKIEGSEKLKGAKHKVIPDRIEAGTFMVASAITGGDIILENVISEHLKPVTAKLAESNVLIEELEGNKMRVAANEKLKPINIKTMPFPGFPTDMQSQFMSLSAVISGTSIITETVFENRFIYAGELRRMGADIKIDSRSAVIEGVKKLTGTQVRATDLRGGAALILSALAAEGETEISDIYHIERGYCNIEKKFESLGAFIKKI
ncbi:UDP-N-acetylglucosamine 1-carboxyvinyltransferase [Tyzzerella sp. An114]|uniref:UDP-N-acetylglucosamine 1-carboxyvinyltransferase n=1 Tax=Tyzzerella sp. An114 TaxID=1965545 RepID=UPI000B44D6FA|nr:UDP-N-acetylglucosamine 1-carboxyvinyltransferase [Tyzzerella sp. An114]OUQ57988.1 UDP-N-acetylglucosamine 1-carboxyvinyltransferase [Tyzzerella sp. An114]HIT72162.1 UDP-N-acetylglucosamine 1-carboxyvinyltransferase [Candidatus Fimicola cottocaccae]